jgi:hypothetical protein
LRAAFTRLKELYPPAVFPDVYFVMGGLSSGGTSLPEGLVIGTDLYGIGPDMPASELPPALVDRAIEAAALPFTVAHESIHFLQTIGGTLLRESLIEGGADFLARLMTGGTAVTGEEQLHAYGDRHEREIWERFRREMNGTDWSNWIANLERVSPGTPSDLGYYVGFKICEAYYHRARNKQQAVQEIVELRDAPGLLAASGYAERFRSR